MKLLSLSDKEIDLLYSPMIVNRFRDIDMVISCGDLPYFYLEFILDMLNCPLYYVFGNHSNRTEFGELNAKTNPEGAVNLHKYFQYTNDLIIAGLEGSVRYSAGPCQYSQMETWQMVFQMIPQFLYNKARYGRYLDIFVTHAPPWKIQDQKDLPHNGFKAYRWLLYIFKPKYHFHGHIHLYETGKAVQTQFYETLVINTFGYRVTSIDTRINR